MYDSRIGRWFAVDPSSSKYPFESNYVAFGNNPILFVDVDGRDIIVYSSDGKSFKYTPGMKAPSNKFANAVVQSLNRVHATGEGKIVVNTLSSSMKKYNIKEAAYLAGNAKSQQNNDATAFYLGKDGERDVLFNKALEKNNFSHAEKIVSETEILLIKIYFGNYETEWKFEGQDPDHIKMNFEIALSHELFHGYQFEVGSLNKTFSSTFNLKTGNVKLNEAQAVGFENYIRAKLFSGTEYGTTRSHYSGNIIPEYYKKPVENWDKVCSFLFGDTKLPLTTFKKGAEGYSKWKNYFSDKLKQSKK